MKERIAILHYTCYPVIGGVEKIIEAHARLFSGNSYKVKIIAGKGSIFDRRIPIKIIKEMDSADKTNQIINKELDKNIISDTFWKRTFFLYKKLKKCIKDSDTIIIHNIMTMHFNLPLTAALRRIIKESDKKFIIWTHDLAPKDPNYKEEIKKRFPFDLLSKKIENTGYVCISEFRKKQLSKLLNLKKDKITVIPDGISMNFLKAKRFTNHIFKSFDLFNQGIVLLLPSRIVKRKNIELAIRITKELNKFKTAKLLITGPPDPHNKGSMRYYNHLTNLIEELNIQNKVIFLFKLGYISDEIIKDLYLLSDALLFPSKQEGFGIPMLEAGLANKPVFCSDIEILKEVGGKDVFYFGIKDRPEKIAKRMIDHYNKHITRDMFKKVIRKYLWENVFKNDIEPFINSL